MNILVTRPKGKGESLVCLLDDVAGSVHYQPVIEIKPGPDLPKVVEQLNTQAIDMLVFVSGFAVEHFISVVKAPLLNNSKAVVFAVGQATADKLRSFTTKTVISPQLETSEGLLALPNFQTDQISGKHIVIVRGVGGRELLAQTLQSQGGILRYWQLYQRLPMTNEGPNWYEQWQLKQIDCIVITSVEILTTIFDSLPTSAHAWLVSRKWIVASHRIGEKAQRLGITPSQIYDAKGAGDIAVLAQVKCLIEK
jgi:uroporphyrinogen-III synthase